MSPSKAEPIGAFPPGAHVFDYNLGAVVTVHRAAPVEFAVAAAHHLRAPLLHPQAALMTQPAAAAPLPLAQTLLVLHALPALGAVQSQADVSPTIVRRVIQVDELRLRDAAQRVHDGTLVVRAVASPHALFVDVELLGLTVLDLQVVSNLSEVWQLRPAGFDAAALRHAVTSAHALHRCLHSLLEIVMLISTNKSLPSDVRLRTSVTHQPSSRVVVQVDSGSGVLTCLLRVNILSGDPLSKVYVVAAAAPQPATTACTQIIKS